MPIKGKVNGGGDFKRLPAGSHIAVCDLVAYLGMQEGMFGSKEQVYVRYEVPAERVEYEKDGQRLEGPIVIGKTYTLSMHQKANLRKDLESWRGKAFTDTEAENFDIASLLGKACLLSVVESFKEGKTYSNIAGVGGLPKGTKAPKAENPLICYDGTEAAVLKKLPEWIQKKIADQIPQEYSNEFDQTSEYDDRDVPIDAYEEETPF